jgi:hypothetical protein
MLMNSTGGVGSTKVMQNGDKIVEEKGVKIQEMVVPQIHVTKINLVESGMTNKSAGTPVGISGASG